MALGLCLRVSWICLLLSSAACFPATKGDYKYPYTATRVSSGESSSGSNTQPEVSHRPLVSLQHEVAPEQPSAPSGKQPSSSVGAPGVAAGSSSYEPSRFIVTFNPSSNKPSSAPVQSPGYVRPPVGHDPPAGTVKKMPVFSVQPRPAGTSGNSNVGSSLAAFSPVYEAPQFPPTSGSAYPAKAAGNKAPAGDSGPAPYDAAPVAYSFGDGPVPYDAAPVAYSFGDGPVPYDAAPVAYSFGDGPVPYDAAPVAYSFGDGPVPYDAAPVAYSFGDGPVPYDAAPVAGDFDAYNPPGLPWDEQPSGGAFGSFSDPSSWMPSRSFPDFNAWDSSNQMMQGASETSPLLPSSYIVQSRNGYQRAREVLAHSKYSPEYPEPPPFPSEPVKALSKSPPVAPPKGGKKL